jgi:sialic acid synthase SpsE
MKNITIRNIEIGKNFKPFIIAEMSGNHNQSIERAFEIVDAAAAAGAHAIKLQTYTADTITMKGVFTINDKNSLWDVF